MKRVLFLLGWIIALAGTAPLLRADPAPPPSASAAAPEGHDDSAAKKTTQAAAVASTHTPPRPPDFLEHLVDSMLEAFNVPSSGNTATHYIISALFLVGALLLRHIVTKGVFGVLKKFAERTETTLDDKLFPALEQPAAAFVMVTGVFAALKVLKLSATADDAINYGSTIAFSMVIFWALLRAFGALLDHAHEVALGRQMSIAAFMPWIKKTLITIFVLFGVLLVVQSLGFDVKAALAGLGIGGLAFALAAQDTLANVFGSIVVAIDQPFKLGEVVQIGANTGTVEDIGLRSTKLRRPDRSLVIVPNKTVASETITNLSRFTQRRAEQVISLTYDATPQQLSEIVVELRNLLLAEPEIDGSSVQVFFRDFNQSSLDIVLAYNSKGPDFIKHMELRQRLNLTIMRLVTERGLFFAYPTQTLHLPEAVVRKLVTSEPPPPKS